MWKFRSPPGEKRVTRDFSRRTEKKKRSNNLIVGHNHFMTPTYSY